MICIIYLSWSKIEKKKNLQNKKKKLELVGIIPEQSLKKGLAILEQFLQF